MLFSRSDAIIQNAKYNTDARTWNVHYYTDNDSVRNTRKLVTSLGKERVGSLLRRRRACPGVVIFYRGGCLICVEEAAKTTALVARRTTYYFSMSSALFEK